jgi:uncharacterized protein with HEPN domain
MSRRNDIDRLRDIHQHARWAIEFLEGHQREDLDGDRNFRLLLERYIEIIGEAAARVSDETTSRIPEVPWQDIIGMRNILIHGSFDIDRDILWKTCHDNLPVLVQTLDAHV